MELVSRNKIDPKHFLLIKTREISEVLTVVTMTVVLLGCDTV
jgi:hypothetical protein